MMHSATCSPVVHPSPSLFTGKERDAESGNDYFGARYYASTMGRFLSPDWSAKEEPVPYAKLDDPQTLNLYGYMRNNPFWGVSIKMDTMHCGSRIRRQAQLPSSFRSSSMEAVQHLIEFSK
jgi:RHS repeat-associated protein